MFEEILSSLRRNKLRTALTGFAVAWGIFILIVLLGAGNGLVHAFDRNAGRMALNSMRVSPGWTSLEYKGLRSGRRVRMAESDVREVRGRLAGNVVDIMPVVYRSAQVSYGHDYVSTSLMGVYPNHTKVEVVRVSQGRFVNQIDIDEKRKVCIVGNKTAEVLFGNEDPIGKFVNASGVTYRVVGVYTDANSNSSQSVYVPFSTVMAIYNTDGYIGRIALTTKGLETVEDNQAFEADLRQLMGERRHFDKDDMGALWIWNRMTNYLKVSGAMDILKTAIWIIGILTLISGIVGVSNIMLITVKERTHEFGIRKALGAKPWQILSLIVTESVVITAIFGYIGMVLGIGATELLDMFVSSSGSEAFTNPTVDLSVAIQATLTLVVAGTLAGFFPAKRAVSIKPIEALRG